MTKEYPRINFDIDQLPGCCGIGVVGRFNTEHPSYYDNYGRRREARTKEMFSTAKKQAEDCYKRLVDETYGEDAAVNDNSFSTLIITLVSYYRDKPAPDHIQLPELHNILIRKGWEISQKFINPNHGNEVTMYTKYFPERVDNFEEAVEASWES